MTNLFFLVFRTFFLTMVTVGMMASLTEFRFAKRKLVCILGIYCIWVIASSIVLLWLGGELLLLRLFFFTISIPATALTYWAANDTPAQAVFNYITQILLSLLAASMIRSLVEWLHLSNLVNILLMCVFYFTVIWLEWRYVRHPFRMLLKVMPTRWGILTLIPCSFCGYLIFLAAWPNLYIQNHTQKIYLYAAIIPLVIVYIVVFKSLIAQYHIQLEQQNSALLAIQISALKEKLKKVREVEEDIRIQRHDLRHQLQVVVELVSRGEKEAALHFLNDAEKHLDEQKQMRWCTPPILDAVFSAYFDQARKQNILVETKISLSNTLPVDEGELAIVFANALENAIHANLLLSAAQRKICCKVVSHPSLMLEISNPCTNQVQFDEWGLPISNQEGHGLGVQSISAFCKKYDAIYQFTQERGWFWFRLIL